jgi:histidinol phosphatase-like enzyme (inositol monophosphatase family)
VSDAPAVERDLLDTAVELTRQAGELTLQWFRRADLEVDTKSDGSPVTQADRAAERLIRDELERRYPDDTIVGEEHPDTMGRSGWRWDIDPIDGTRSFTRGVAMYTTLLALTDEHGPALGVAFSPASDELVAAGRGLGCSYNGSPCAVSDTDRLDGAYLTTSGYDYWAEAALHAVARSGVNMRTWGDGYGYLLLATGRVDVMVDPGLNPWDVAPMNVIIPEAGGRITDFGGRDTPHSGDVVASNGRVHDDVLSMLAQDRPATQ